MEKGGIARERAGVSQEVHTPRCSLCLSLSGLTGALAHGAGREIQAAVSRGRGVSSHAPRSVVRMRVRWRRQRTGAATSAATYPPYDEAVPAAPKKRR